MFDSVRTAAYLKHNAQIIGLGIFLAVVAVVYIWNAPPEWWKGADHVPAVKEVREAKVVTEVVTSATSTSQESVTGREDVPDEIRNSVNVGENTIDQLNEDGVANSGSGQSSVRGEGGPAGDFVD
jgi:hypothetical protein